MQGETRKVVGLTPFAGGGGGSKGGLNSKVKATVPPDNSFWFGSRVKLAGQALRDPYRNHAYFHAAVKRVSAAIASAPFRIFRDSASAEGSGTQEGARREAFTELKKIAPKIPQSLYEIYNSRGEAVRRRLVRDMYRDIRALAPAAPLGLVLKAVGVEMVEKGPWHELFRDVNPEMTRSQLWEASTVYMYQDGETFWLPLVRNGDQLVKWKPPEQPIPGEKQGAFVPAEIWPVSETGWKPIADPKRGRIAQWEWTHTPLGTNEQKKEKFDANQIGHYRFFDPLVRARGLSPADALKIELSQDYNAARYNEAFFERGAQLPWVMIFEQGLSELQREDVEDQMLRDYSGLDNMWRPAVFEGNAKIESVGMSQRDMDYQNLRMWVRDEVLAVVGTPKSEMGIFGDVNRASAIVSKRVFWENTNLPLMHYYEDNTDSWLFAPVTGGTVFGVFDTSRVEALRDDLTGKVAVAEKLYKMGFTADEINERLDLGFEPHPARALVWLNQNMRAYDETVTAESANETPGGGNGGGGEGSPPPGGGENPDVSDEVSLFDDAEGDDDPGKGVIVTPGPSRAGRIFNEADTEAVALVAAQAARVQRTIDTVRRQLIVVLAFGMKNNLTKAALLASIRAKLAFLASVTHISAAVRTEIAQITSIARNVEARRKNVKTNVWITARDNRVRSPEHTTLDAQVGEQGFNFAKLIPGYGGATLEFPLDPRAPAKLVVNCRCVLVPSREEVTRVWSDEEKDRVWERVVTRVFDPNEKRFIKEFRSVLWRVRGAQLARIEAADLETATPESLAFVPHEFKQDLTKRTLPVYKQTWSDAVDEYNEELQEIGIIEPDPFA